MSSVALACVRKTREIVKAESGWGEESPAEIIFPITQARRYGKALRKRRLGQCFCDTSANSTTLMARLASASSGPLPCMAMMDGVPHTSRVQDSSAVSRCGDQSLAHYCVHRYQNKKCACSGASQRGACVVRMYGSAGCWVTPRLFQGDNGATMQLGSGQQSAWKASSQSLATLVGR